MKEKGYTHMFSAWKIKTIKKLISVAIAFGFIFAAFGCGSKDAQPTYEQIAAQCTFADRLPETDLPRPARTINGEQDLVYALDYLAFYRISSEISFDIGEEYAKTFTGIYREFTRVFAITSLAEPYPVSLDQQYYDDYKIITVRLRISEIADVAPEEIDTSVPFVLPFDYEPQLNARAADYNGFETEKSGKSEVLVETSEQLWYAVNRGYKPVPAEGSAAETIYNEAKNVLRRIISDDMYDYEKVKAIFNFLSCEVRYDSVTANAASADADRAQCYYLEGVFLNRYAVCDGKSKAYCLLAGMEGIPIVRVTDYKANHVGHSYNYVQVQGNWYLSCTTFAASVLDFGEEGAPEKRIVPQYNMLLTCVETPLGSGWGYDSEMYTDIKNSIEDGFFDYWGYTEIEVGGETKTLAVSSAEELKSILFAISENRASMENIIVEFRLQDCSDDIDDIIDIISPAFAEYNVQYLQNRPLELDIYSVVFLASTEV